MSISQDTPRRALVVGASSGIGRTTAKRFAAQGIHVVGAARRADRLRDLAEESDVEVVVGSIESPDGCRAIVEEATGLLGGIDILVNVAAIGAAHEQSVVDEPLSDWRLSISMNLEAPFVLLQAVARGMCEQRFGRIVFVTSTAAELGGPRMPAYCASKHGLLGLVRASAIDLAPYGVTCNAVGPGWVRTEMSQRLVDAMASSRGESSDEIWAEIERGYPSGRVATETEVAHAIAMLVADDASGISGQHVAVAMGGSW